MSYDDLARNLDTYADGHCREANDDDSDASLDFEAWSDVLAGEYPNLAPVLLLCADRETGTLQSFGGIGVNADAMRSYLRRAASAEGEHRTINVEATTDPTCYVCGKTDGEIVGIDRHDFPGMKQYAHWGCIR